MNFLYIRQYYGDYIQSIKLSGQYMRDWFNDFVKQIKANLPNGLISWDISPWIGDKGFIIWQDF